MPRCAAPGGAKFQPAAGFLAPKEGMEKKAAKQRKVKARRVKAFRSMLPALYQTGTFPDCTQCDSLRACALGRENYAAALRVSCLRGVAKTKFRLLLCGFDRLRRQYFQYRRLFCERRKCRIRLHFIQRRVPVFLGLAQINQTALEVPGLRKRLRQQKIESPAVAHRAVLQNRSVSRARMIE